MFRMQERFIARASRPVILAGCAAMLALLSPRGEADGKRYTATLPTWQNECGSCHVAYPAALLPRETWRKMMAQLDRHFGTDASLDPQSASEITRFLETNAASGKRAARTAGTLRITETAWFRHEHDEVPGSVWKGAAVESPANCAACHTQADRGDYRERTLRVPRGGQSR
jgi:hypothetical protein